MGLSPLNLQLSVPRAPELSNMQQQAINRPIMEQTMLESSVVKETEQKRSQAAAVEETDKGMIRDEQKEHNRQGSKKKTDMANSEHQQQEQASGHPYKGHHLDIRL